MCFDIKNIIIFILWKKSNIKLFQWNSLIILYFLITKYIIYFSNILILKLISLFIRKTNMENFENPDILKLNNQ